MEPNDYLTAIKVVGEIAGAAVGVSMLEIARERYVAFRRNKTKTTYERPESKQYQPRKK